VIVTPMAGACQADLDFQGCQGQRRQDGCQAGVDVDEQEAQIDFTPDMTFPGTIPPTPCCGDASTEDP
jgi:hypothetical protein